MDRNFNGINHITQEMNTKNGYKILTELSSHFNTSVPLLEFNLKREGRRQGFYKRSLNREVEVGHIVINVGGDWVNTLLHEYAHHLDFCKHGDGVTHHTKSFARCLYQIVRVYYGSFVGLYTWGIEKPSVRHFYRLNRKIILLWQERDFLEKEMSFNK